MKLFFQHYGEGPPLIILHGLLGSLDNWHTLSRRFAAHFSVYSLDQRNHGRSPHSEDFTYVAMAGDLREFADEQGISSFSLVGHSIGGKTAMRFALDHPDRIRRLVVVDIGPGAYPPHHDHIFDALTSLDFSKLHSRKEIEEALNRDISSRTTLQFLLKNLKRNNDGRFAWKMNLETIRRHYDEVNKAVDSATPFGKPTLFVRSTKSNYVGNTDIPGIKRLFPQSSIVDLNVGHWIHAEAPDQFFQIVLDFLGQTKYY